MTPHPANKRPLRSGAFSLVEVVMAIGIASFSLLATVGLLANGYSTAAEARARTNMTAIATRAFAQVSEEVRAGNDPGTALADYVELFDAEGMPLTSPADSSLWAYRSSLNFAPVTVGSGSENTQVLRAEAQIESRRETRRLHQFFALQAPRTPATP